MRAYRHLVEHIVGAYSGSKKWEHLVGAYSDKT